MAEKKRIFVGGLFSSVTEGDLESRFSKFGNIHNVDIRIRKDDTGCPSKTFAFIDGDFTEYNLKKCFSVYNKNKWKGSELCLQLAKEDFLDKLKRERAANESREVDEAVADTPSLPSPVPVKDREVKGAVPGTLIPGEKNWVVGKYSRALPIVYIRRKDKRKIAKMDPSKFCHNVKRIKESENEDQSVQKLTWEMEEADSEILKRVQGNFPEFHPKKKEKSEQKKSVTDAMEAVRMKMTNSQSYETDDSVDSDDSLEVVKSNPLPRGLTLKEKMERIAGMDVSHAFGHEVESDDSAATDEIIESSKQKCSLGDSSVSCDKYSSNVSVSSNPDSRPKRQKTKQDNSQVSIKKLTVLSKKEMSENRDNNSTNSLNKNISKTKGNVKQKSKPPPFLGTKRLQSSSPLNQKTDIQMKSSDKNNSTMKDLVQSKSGNKSNIAKKEKVISKENITKSAILYNSSESEDEIGGNFQKDFPIHSANNSCIFKAKESRIKVDNSVLMNEYSSGLLPEGMSFDKWGQDSAESDSDYDSEDYEKLAQKVPKGNQFLNRREEIIIPSEIQTNTSLDVSSDNESSDSSENLSETSEMEDLKASDLLTPNVSAIKCKKLSRPSRGGEDKSSYSSSKNTNVTVENNSDEDSSIPDSECVPISPSVNKFHMQSTSTPLPGKSDVKGDNSYGEDQTESSLSLDEFSTRFLANAGDLSSSSSDSNDTSDSDEATMSDGSTSKSFEHFTQLKKSKQLDKSANEKSNHLKNKELDAPLARKDLSKNSSSQNLNIDKKATKIQLTPGKTVEKNWDKDDSKEKKQTLDNQKRLKSLRERQKESLSQKSAVQAALKSVDSAPKGNKKIVFSSDDEEVMKVSKLGETSPSNIEQKDQATSNIKKSEKKSKLFESSSEDSSEEDSSDGGSDAEMFQIKPQFQGQAGKKLMKIQARFGNDPRFKLDQRFLDINDNDDTAEVDVIEEETEKSRMMKILNDIVGVKLPPESENSKKTFKGAVRYDPSKADHKQFEVKSEIQKKVKITQMSEESGIKREKTTEQLAREIVPEVSMERYYQISTSLLDTFRKTDDTPAAGFSLLAAFGRPEEDLEIDNKQSQEEVELPKAASMFPWQQKLVQDSSDEENEELMEEERLKDMSVDKKSSESKNLDITIPKTFFFKADDSRLKGGVEFFCRHGDVETIREKWLEERPRLIEAYRSVHRRVSRRVRLSQSRRGRRSHTNVK